MIFIVVFLALLMAVVAFWLIRQTVSVQPWVATSSTVGVNDIGFTTTPSLAVANAKIGLGVFLAVATSLFALFVSAYLIRMGLADWRPLPDPSILWWNSAVLVLGSVSLQWAVVAGRREDVAKLRIGLIGGGLCAVVFVAGQLIAWSQLTAAGYFLGNNPANSFFYVLTALHGLHLLGGLVAWGRTMLRSVDGADFARVRLGVELCAAYWHFLLLVWLVLFGLMLST